MNEKPAQARRRTTGRSPSYPAISLPVAIERARSLYSKEKQFATPLDAVVKHWGYTTLNGPAGLAVAALKKYGLVTEEGSKSERRVQVSDLAVRILEHPIAASREEAIREAALKPVIHQEMWQTYGDDLPSDSNLIWTLSRERGFTESGAREFMREYRDTLEFAKLGDGADVPDADEDVESEDDEPTSSEQSSQPARPTIDHAPTAAKSSSRVQTYTVPVGVGSNVIVQGEFPLSDLEWSQFMAVLNAMRPGLVSGPSETAASDGVTDD